jgi:hypothetical protein
VAALHRTAAAAAELNSGRGSERASRGVLSGSEPGAAAAARGAHAAVSVSGNGEFGLVVSPVSSSRACVGGAARCSARAAGFPTTNGRVG